MDKDKRQESQGNPVTLSDADITSRRRVSRRSFLTALGIGTGVAAATVFGTATPAQADTRRCYRDRDPSDRVARYCDRDPIRRSDRARCYRDRDSGDRVSRYCDRD
jgi:hypothetical protein